MTEPTELLLCPFCGGTARKVKHSAGVPGTTGYDRWHGVACAGCNACVGARDRRFRTSTDAIAVWNTRAPQPTQAVPPAGREMSAGSCWCLTCRPMLFEDPYSIRMALCPACGNKRCPKANDHRNTCTGSNEPGQPGSAYVGGIKGGQHGAE